MSEAVVELEVDGQVFEVRYRADGSGHYDFDWLNGPNPGYGFSSKSAGDAEPRSQAELEEAIRNFLKQVDPVTGYIE
ncbi:hypothetical protein AB0P21_21290 [Kribbella sp. NPDC056861]|uniref:hypothetical protein n=1 Tax=Kribbella sp. NPDC056861 TaxID=3154857 RepID=UPI0034426F46